jgi:uncharacterized 2Fe-2S/4Fe-4S cluster protein (DUF4445 family)
VRYRFGYIAGLIDFTMSDQHSKEDQFEIDLEPIGRRTTIEAGQTLLDAARQAGVQLVSLCGGAGLCDSCKVKLVQGELTPIRDVEMEALFEGQIEEGYRLACQAKPLSDVKIEIPPESLSTPQRLQVEGIRSSVELDLPIKTYDLEIDPAHLDDLRSDFSRLSAKLGMGSGPLKMDLAVMSSLAPALRENHWRIRVAVRGDEIVGVFAPDTPMYGLAVDIGTTKIAAYLVELTSGKTVAKSGAMNPQIAFGEDVVSRIAYANRQEGGREILRTRLAEEINNLVDQLCPEGGTERGNIIEAVVVGNTAMHHFFSGLPVRQLGESPYVPVTSDALEFRASASGLNLAPGAYVYLPPNIAGYVGADHVAVLIGTRVWETDQVLLAVDVGTNTEITLVSGGRMVTCSCASGPAFEGAHIRDGMRAAPGAIERVQLLEGEIKLQTIGGVSPVGICGSGILDAVAVMLQAGILTDRGSFIQDAANVRKRDGKPEFILNPAAKSGNQRDITISRKDINEIQLAKGAIRAGIDILLEEAGITPEEVENVALAGAFGTYIDVESALRVGMFPPIPKERFHQVGNAAGVGAKDLLISSSLRRKAREIKKQVEYIELTTHPGFMATFLERMYF